MKAWISNRAEPSEALLRQYPESPKDHVGFVMGHNTLDEYWDVAGHPYLRQACDRGRNGDFSTKLAICDIQENESESEAEKRVRGGVTLANVGGELEKAKKEKGNADEALERQRSKDLENRKTQPGWGRTEAHRKKWEELKAKQAEADKRLSELEARQANAQEGKPLTPEVRPGLKIHICTLVSPDTPDGVAWPEVYIHAKLMLINDTYMTLGSANINNRSMERDTELNIAHCKPQITQAARRELWAQHTGGMGAQDDMEKAFDAWAVIIDRNRGYEKIPIKPWASLRGFMRTDPTISKKD